jgi:integrase
VILLAAHAGLRKGETRALRCGDCEMARDRLVVRRSRWKNHTKTTKSGNEREVPLTPQLRAALLAAGVDKRPADECAALNRRGEAWGHRGPYEVFQSTLRRVKLPPVRLHALRTFFVTTLLNGRVPVHVARKLAGHGNLATTQKYAAIFDESCGEAVGVLDRAYEGARGVAHQSDAKPRATRAPGRSRRLRSARWTSMLRRRLLARRSAGNGLETTPIAAE